MTAGRAGIDGGRRDGPATDRHHASRRSLVYGTGPTGTFSQQSGRRAAAPAAARSRLDLNKRVRHVVDHPHHPGHRRPSCCSSGRVRGGAGLSRATGVTGTGPEGSVPPSRAARLSVVASVREVDGCADRGSRCAVGRPRPCRVRLHPRWHAEGVRVASSSCSRSLRGPARPPCPSPAGARPGGRRRTRRARLRPLPLDPRQRLGVPTDVLGCPSPTGYAPHTGTGGSRDSGRQEEQQDVP